MNEAYNLMTPSEKAIVANNANDRALVNDSMQNTDIALARITGIIISMVIHIKK